MNRYLSAALLLGFSVLLPSSLLAKVDLVTLPEREKVELTIYNSADLTLVRDVRSLTMREGANRLQFSWAGTLIDPTSLELKPLNVKDGALIESVEYPPRVNGVGIWNVKAAKPGKIPFEISAFTSGLSWRSYYLAVLTPDESAVELKGYVRVDNRSGEDFDNAATRLVVGNVNLLDQVADLARRQHPFGRPGPVYPEAPAAMGRMSDMAMEKGERMVAKAAMMEMRPKEIVKEGLSEYFLYSIEGTEDLPNGWGKRLISLSAPKVPVVNLYRFEEETYGEKPVRYLSFVNDPAHGLGKEPLPEGGVMVFKRVPEGKELAFVGSQEVKYVPKGGEVAMNLGVSDLVAVKPELMDYSTENYEWRKYSPQGRNTEEITGFDQRKTFRVEAMNSQPVPARVEIRRNFTETPKWEISSKGDYGAFTKVDADTVEYVLELPPYSKKTFTYEVVLHYGSRAK